ncbi:glycosyltransferase [bacterium]|nr:glycosyltransferase [bacterium]
MKLSIVIVNYNVKYFLEQCLHSCHKAMAQMAAAHPNWESDVWVVDNNSVDGSVEMVRERFKWVKLLANKDNKGFSKANNQAIRQSEGEYVLLLNPDTVVEEDTFLKCVEFMDENPDGGGLGVKMLDGKGNFLPESKRGLPAPDVAFFKIFGFSALFPKSKIFGKYHLGFLDNDETHSVDVLAGAFMMLRHKALDEVGLLDETFFMYGEDIDLSYRLTLGGYKNYYLPSTRIIHYKGESTKKDSVNYVFVFYNAMIIFAKKHFNANNARLFTLLISIAIYLRAALSIITRFVKNIAHPAVDWALNFAALVAAGHWYEHNIKLSDGDYYPDDFFNFILPIYSLIWVFGAVLTGSYKWSYQISRVFKGVMIGTILVAIFYAFLNEDLRFSRAMVLIGSVVSFLVFYASRWLLHFFREGHPFLGRIKPKRMVIVGGEHEAARVNELLVHSGIQHEVVGFVSPGDEFNKGFLGSSRQLNDVVNIHKIDEVIFCSKDMKSSDIFNLMLGIDKTDLFYKIVPEESLFIIGSNSKNQPGDYYTIDVKLALKSPENQFNKRVVDLLVALLLTATLPLSILAIKDKKHFIANLWHVLIGKLTWVGYSSTQLNENLPHLRKGVLKPIDRYRELKLEVKAINRIDLAYARNYHFTKDIDIILKGFSRLGAKV